jgi:hypothetical protein
MPAQSKAQQRFMGMVHAVQKGDMEAPSKEVEKAADSMKKKDAKDYASTKHKGLPMYKETISRERLKELVKEVMVEEADYQAFFKKALEKAGKGINDMTDDEKKAFFNKVDSAWNGRGEKTEALKGDQHKLDVDGDGDIEGDDLADLRAGKTNEDISTELPKATIPSAINQRLELAISKISAAKLSSTQKLQLIAKMVDGLGLDKTQLGNITSKIRSKMESVNEDFSKGELVWFNRGQNERGMTISTPVVGRLSKIVGSKNVEIQVISPSNSKGDIFTTDKNSLKMFPQKGKKVRMDVVMNGGQGSGSQSFDEIEGVVVSADPNTKQIVIKNKEGKNVKLHLYNILKIK